MVIMVLIIKAMMVIIMVRMVTGVESPVKRCLWGAVT